MNIHLKMITGALCTLITLGPMTSVFAQVPPTTAELQQSSDLHQAAYLGDTVKINQLVANGADLEFRDSRQRTAVHFAAYASQETALIALAKASADLNALEFQKYDIVTIASVANDTDFLKTALKLGANADNMTSLYDGTALIAAAHLGHHEVVQILIDGRAPLNHVNNLHWTALIESIVLGDGGENHVKTARALVEAGANKLLADRDGVTPLEHAQQRGYSEMIKVLSD